MQLLRMVAAEELPRAVLQASLADLVHWGHPEWISSGLSAEAIRRIRAIFIIAMRMPAAVRSQDERMLKAPEDVYALMAPRLAHLEQEEV